MATRSQVERLDVRQLCDLLSEKLENDLSTSASEDNRVNGKSLLELTDAELAELAPLIGDRKAIRRFINSFLSTPIQVRISHLALAAFSCNCKLMFFVATCTFIHAFIPYSLVSDYPVTWWSCHSQGIYLWTYTDTRSVLSCHDACTRDESHHQVYSHGDRICSCLPALQPYSASNFAGVRPSVSQSRTKVSCFKGFNWKWLCKSLALTYQ